MGVPIQAAAVKGVDNLSKKAEIMRESIHKGWADKDNKRTLISLANIPDQTYSFCKHKTGTAVQIKKGGRSGRGGGRTGGFGGFGGGKGGGGTIGAHGRGAKLKRSFATTQHASHS